MLAPRTTPASCFLTTFEIGPDGPHPHLRAHGTIDDPGLVKIAEPVTNALSVGAEVVRGVITARQLGDLERLTLEHVVHTVPRATRPQDVHGAEPGPAQPERLGQAVLRQV